jgi:metal iron transporter
MTVTTRGSTTRTGNESGEEANGEVQNVQMRNHWITAVFAVLIWLVIVIMNVANLVLVGLGVN